MEDKVVEYGKCQCGCGCYTTIAKQTDNKRGVIKGEPMRFKTGHYKFRNGVGGPDPCWRRRRKTWPEVLLHTARARALKNGLEWDIVKEDIVIPEFCPALGIKLARGDRIIWDGSATLDRIDNSKGYTKDNISVVSYKANRMHSNGTAEELRKIADYLDSIDPSLDRVQLCKLESDIDDDCPS